MATTSGGGVGLRGLAALLAALALPACGVPEAVHEATRVAPEATPVELARVGRGDVVRRVRGAGLLRAKSEIDLSFKVGGVLAVLRVDRGAAVKKGQVLAALDPTEVAAGLRQASEVDRRATRELDRARRLYESGAVSRGVLDDAETQSATAAAGASAARFNAGRATLVAPEDGWIDARAAEPGEVVAPGRPILRMSGKDRGWVLRASVSDREAVRLVEGAAATVTIDALPDTPLSGAVTQIAPVASGGTGTYEVEVRVDAPPGTRLLAGLSGKLEIARAEPDLLRVPLAALVDASGRDASVHVVTGDVARRVAVRVAFLSGPDAAIAADLGGADAVVTRGTHALRDGSRVRVVTPDAARP